MGRPSASLLSAGTQFPAFDRQGQEVAPPADLDYCPGGACLTAHSTTTTCITAALVLELGRGELGNNGVISWICPVRSVSFYAVASTGGRLRYSDDQETHDTNVGTWQFGGNKAIAWEGYSCTKLPVGRFPDILFHGEKGTLAISGDSYTIYDLKGKQVEAIKGTGKDEAHLDNFFDAVRGSAKPNSEIEEGHKTTMLCHLGNIAYRMQRGLRGPASNSSSTTSRP